MQSAPYTIPVISPVEAKRQADVFSSMSKCGDNTENDTTLACLRSKSMEELISAGIQYRSSHPPFSKSYTRRFFMPWGGVVDDEFITDDVMVSMDTGRYENVSVILGNVRGDSIAFVESLPKTSFLESMAFVWAITPTGMLSSSSAIYPFSEYSNATSMMQQLVLDTIFKCPTRQTASILTARGASVYEYEFFPTPRDQIDGAIVKQDDRTCAWKSCHGVDVGFLFQTFDDVIDFLPEDYDISDTMIAYWSNLVHSGNPNQPKPMDVHWPMSQQDEILNIDFPPNLKQTTLNSKACDHFDSFFGNNYKI